MIPLLLWLFPLTVWTAATAVKRLRRGTPGASALLGPAPDAAFDPPSPGTAYSPWLLHGAADDLFPTNGARVLSRGRLDFDGGPSLTFGAGDHGAVHNALNQTVLITPAGGQGRTLGWNADGGLASDGAWAYAYDAEGRLASTTQWPPSDGSVRILNGYDWRHRRISKTLQAAVTVTNPPPALPVGRRVWRTFRRHDFTYDGWNLIHETVTETVGAATNVTERQYFWGPDLSGSLQGAGGVGGLLAVSVGDRFHFPCYDANGNVTKYLDESGNAVAAYTYGDFGETLERSGPMADVFPYRFSTKYLDAETGLYDYGYRFYSPALKRWMSRDPIGEEGGVNLYGFCGNDSLLAVDLFGLQRWYLFYYSHEEQPNFKKAAETARRNIMSESSFDNKCDIVVLCGALTDDEFVSKWNSMKNDDLGTKYGKVKEVRIFTHSGVSQIFMYVDSIKEETILNLQIPDWTSDGKIVLHGCYSGIGGDHSLAYLFANRQGVTTEGQNGKAGFSTRHDYRNWYTRVYSFNSQVYLWAYGNGTSEKTFGKALPSVVVYPSKKEEE